MSAPGLDNVHRRGGELLVGEEERSNIVLVGLLHDHLGQDVEGLFLRAPSPQRQHRHRARRLTGRTIHLHHRRLRLLNRSREEKHQRSKVTRSSVADTRGRWTPTTVVDTIRYQRGDEHRTRTLTHRERVGITTGKMDHSQTSRIWWRRRVRIPPTPFLQKMETKQTEKAHKKHAKAARLAAALQVQQGLLAAFRGSVAALRSPKFR